MRSNAKKIIIIIITIGILFTLSCIIYNNFNFTAENIENSTSYNADFNLDNKNLKISAVSEKIQIDNNWTAAKVVGICTGNGTYSEPYVIEDLVIDGGGSGSCILIENSDVYFKIENCTVYNSGPSHPNAGIRLSNVNNSLIIRNNCSSNYYGIFLSEYNNNTISGNTVNNNTRHGIYLFNSNNTIVLGNTVNNNTSHGIYLFNSNNAIVLGNNATNNLVGIYLSTSDHNNVSGNIANSNNDDGIYLSGGYRNTFSGNNASYNKDSGIVLSYSDFNFLLGNTVKNNILYGVYLRQSRNNIIEGNFIINNDVGIYLINNLYYYTLFQVKSADNEISNNNFDGNNQDIREVINVIYHPFRSLIFSLLILLSIATVGIVIISLTVELNTKKSYPREDKKYHPPIYGISASVVESVGALLFILGAIFLIPIDDMLLWLLILIPFSLFGIKLSREGLKKDATKFSARLGLGFGIPLLILGSLLIIIVILIVIAVIVVIYILILSS